MQGSYLTFIVACPIEGQVRLQCARHPSCHGRCNRNDNNTICPLVCIVNGCECPNGTIIDDVKKECVAPNECTGTHIQNTIYGNYIL